jgi:hypothetical protein
LDILHAKLPTKYIYELWTAPWDVQHPGMCSTGDLDELRLHWQVLLLSVERADAGCQPTESRMVFAAGRVSALRASVPP